MVSAFVAKAFDYSVTRNLSDLRLVAPPAALIGIVRMSPGSGHSRENIPYKRYTVAKISRIRDIFATVRIAVIWAILAYGVAEAGIVHYSQKQGHSVDMASSECPICYGALGPDTPLASYHCDHSLCQSFERFKVVQPLTGVISVAGLHRGKGITRPSAWRFLGSSTFAALLASPHRGPLATVVLYPLEVYGWLGAPGPGIQDGTRASAWL